MNEEEMDKGVLVGRARRVDMWEEGGSGNAVLDVNKRGIHDYCTVCC